MDWPEILPLRVLVGTFYLLAMINPVSKVAVLSSLAGESGEEEFRALAARASLAAVFILLVAMLLGEFILRAVFRVELHALRLAGGIVLFQMGFSALGKGIFFEQSAGGARYRDLAMVPLACPMIAGPATIVASMAIRASDGLFESLLAMLAAVAINHAIMRATNPLTRLLSRYNLLGAVIRITGLIVMTIGAQMGLDALADWLARDTANLS